MIKVMIVDPSAVARQHMSALLTAGGLTVVGTAPDPIFAMQHMKQVWPDVLILDVDMPRMDGITFLKQLMAERPTPVVMCSTLMERGTQATMQALSAGAVGFVTKPKLGLKDFLASDSNGILAAVKAAAKVNMAALHKTVHATATERVRGTVSTAVQQGPSERVIAMGLSTGGVQTIEAVLTRLPLSVPGMVVVQHMPAHFTADLAARLNAVCDLDVREAQDGDPVLHGRVLLAPGGRHMRLLRRTGQYVVEVFDGPLVNHHRPCVDVLFKSVAQAAGPHAIGVVMTGMGDDGAQGLRDLREAGAMTAAQDEASCVVFGMPREAVKRGGVQHVVTLTDMPAWLMHAATQPVLPA